MLQGPKASTPPRKATDRNRTGNLQITNQVLCQLSYGGVAGERTTQGAC